MASNFTYRWFALPSHHNLKRVSLKNTLAHKYIIINMKYSQCLQMARSTLISIFGPFIALTLHILKCRYIPPNLLLSQTWTCLPLLHRPDCRLGVSIATRLKLAWHSAKRLQSSCGISCRSGGHTKKKQNKKTTSIGMIISMVYEPRA